MRRTRFMTWFFLTLSLAFFCMRDFRVALETPLLFSLPAFWTGEHGSLERGREFSASIGCSLPLPFRILEGMGLAGHLNHRFTLEHCCPAKISA